MNSDVETVVISLREYKELLYDSKKLNCLMNNGVDNWDWYGEAMNEFNEDED